MKCRIDNKPVSIRRTPVWTPPYNGFSENYFVICTENRNNWKKGLSVEVDFETEITSAVIRPLSAGICYEIQGSKIRFNLKEPCNLSVEINESLREEDVLHLYGSEKKDQDSNGYEHLILLDQPVYDMDELKVTKDNTLIFLAEGTVVHGKILADRVKNLKICGSGILTMEKYLRRGDFIGGIRIEGCKNVVVEDICLLDSCGWSLHLSGCDHVEISNIKIIGSRGNADGIDVCGSRNVHVEHCFIRTYDDCLVVKAFDTGNVENLLFEKCVLWNDMARPMEVGVEIRCEELKNVVFRDIDVIHNLTCYPIFGIHHGDRARLSDIHFENIRIEHAPGAQLFDFRITDSIWNTDSRKGSIRDVFVKDIFLLGKEGNDFRTLRARIEGADENADIRDVYLEHINVYGKEIQNNRQLGLELTGAVENVIWTASKTADDPGFVLEAVEDAGFVSIPADNIDSALETTTERAALTVKDKEIRDTGCIESSISLQEEFSLENDGKYHGIVVMTVANYGKEAFVGKCGIRIFPKNKGISNEIGAKCKIPENTEKEFRYEVTAQAGKLVIESFADSILFRPDIVYRQLPYFLKEEIEQAPIVRFDNYYGNVYGEARFALRNGFLEMHSDLLKEYEMNLYAALPVKEKDNEVLFAVEESFFGEAPSIKRKNNRLTVAPEIGNHFEITYVFKNYPDAEVRKVPLERRHNGIIKIPLTSFGFAEDTKDFLLEILVQKQTPYDKPLTLFRSTLPEETAHMYGRFTTVLAEDAGDYE